MAFQTYTRLKLLVEQSLSSDYTGAFLADLLTGNLAATLSSAQRIDFDLTNVAQDIPTVLANVKNTLILLNLDSSATITASLREHGGSANKSFVVPANGLAVWPGLALASCTLTSSAVASKAYGYILSPSDSTT